MKASTIGGAKSDKHEREKDDFYPTPPECTIALMRYLGPHYFGDKIWEPACGDGAMVHPFMTAGHTVIATDLVDRGYGIAGVDFLKTSLIPGVTSIVTNPPFSLAPEFIRHCRAMGVAFAMLTKATFWQAGSRRELFYETRPRLKLDMQWRPAMKPQRGKSPTMEFAWTVWGADPAESCTYDLIPRP